MSELGKRDPEAVSEGSDTTRKFGPLALVLLGLVALYRCFSKMFPPTCRYHPSCSEYATEAIKKYGAAKGLVLSVARVVRCNPLSPGGYDPVP